VARWRGSRQGAETRSLGARHVSMPLRRQRYGRGVRRVNDVRVARCPGATRFVAAGVSNIDLLGVLPVGLEIIGFGIVLGRGTDHGVRSGVFGMSYIVFGTLLGIGFTRSGMMENA
jgi:hypothetical protein